MNWLKKMLNKNCLYENSLEARQKLYIINVIKWLVYTNLNIWWKFNNCFPADGFDTGTYILPAYKRKSTKGTAVTSKIIKYIEH